MCGIVGYATMNGMPAAISIVRQMADAISHRGPDGEGYWVDDYVALGHRRLSIIDLTESGQQPMQSRNGRYVLVYNGEIYNYPDLKVELRSLGHTFQSTSDTEVLLEAISEWGIENALDRLNGIFAFALWDNQERMLHLARDRFGVKPLYFGNINGQFLFGSEIKGILAHNAVKPELDTGALVEYLAFQNFHSDRTLFKNIHMLPAGSHMSICPEKHTFSSPRKFYQLQFNAREYNPSNHDEMRERLTFLFRQAVSRQLISDVPVGAYLSGGIDSGAITAAAASELQHLRTFTCGFDMSSASGLELYFDERRDAEAVSSRWGTEQYEMVLKAGDMERTMSKLVWHMEEPRVGQSYPNFYVAGLASKFNKVVLAGTGGDEMFGGYPWRYTNIAAQSNPDFLENTYQQWLRLMSEDQLRGFVAPIGESEESFLPRDVFDSVFPQLKPGASELERLDAVMTYEATTFLHGLLVMEDKVAMAHGLEARIPFLDNDLVEFALHLPPNYRIQWPISREKQNGRTNEGKLLLRESVRDLLPDDVANRVKQGFSAPDASWYRGESIKFVKSQIDRPNARIYEVLDYNTVKPLIDEHFGGHQNRRLLIWSLTYLEHAFEIWNL